MKKLAEMVKVEEVENEGLISLMGEQVLIFALSFIYAGKLVGVNDKYIKLEDARIVYETGAFDKPGYIDAQYLPKKIHYVMQENIESFGYGK